MITTIYHSCGSCFHVMTRSNVLPLSSKVALPSYKRTCMLQAKSRLTAFLPINQSRIRSYIFLVQGHFIWKQAIQNPKEYLRCSGLWIVTIIWIRSERAVAFSKAIELFVWCRYSIIWCRKVLNGFSEPRLKWYISLEKMCRLIISPKAAQNFYCFSRSG